MFIFCIEGKITDVNFLQSIFNFKCDRLLKNIPFLMFHFYGNIKCTGLNTVTELFFFLVTPEDPQNRGCCHEACLCLSHSACTAIAKLRPMPVDCADKL